MRIAHLTFLCFTYSMVYGDTEQLKDNPIESQIFCSKGEDCDVKSNTDATDIDERTKYLIERAKAHHEVHKHDGIANRSNKILREKIAAVRNAVDDLEQWLDGYVNDAEESINVDAANKENDEKSADPPALYEFPPLTRVDPGKVGDEVELELEEGMFYKRITRATQPPVFEILNFLSDEECQEFIEAGTKLGLDTSGLFGRDIEEDLKTQNNSNIPRISDQTWIRRDDVSPELWTSLFKRLSVVTQMPVHFLHRSEPIQLVKYQPGGHYHAHLDTTDTSVEENKGLPCCFQTHCGVKETTTEWGKCCRLCRYFTVMYYLSDVEEGGETAFPLGDMSEELYEEKTTNIGEQRWYNLSKYCYNSSVIVKPRKGSAIFWYTHFVDEETGYLGKSDYRSHHGGCDLIKGIKWIANNFISATTYEDRFKASVWYTGP